MTSRRDIEQRVEDLDATDNDPSDVTVRFVLRDPATGESYTDSEEAPLSLEECDRAMVVSVDDGGQV